MLEKIIDKYFAKKLEQELKVDLSVYCLDKKFIYTKHCLELSVKKRMWQEKYYVIIMVIPYEECFTTLTKSYKSLIADLERMIKSISRERDIV